MASPLRSLLLASLFALGTAAGGCIATDNLGPPPPQVIRAEVLLTGHKVQIVRIKGDAALPESKPAAGKELGWEVRGPKDELRAEGVTTDPRFARAEFGD